MTALFWRDVRLAFRSGGGFGLAIVFFLVVIVLLPLGVGPDQSVLGKVSPGVLWVGALLACLLSLDRIFATDWEDGSLEWLVTAPVPISSVVMAKSLAHWVTTGLPLCLAAPVLAILINLPPAGLIWLVVSLAVGTPALSFIGAFGSALTVGIKRGGLLLSLLVLPLYIPTLVFGAEITRRGAAGLPVDAPLMLLAGITLATVAALPVASAAVLRIALR